MKLFKSHRHAVSEKIPVHTPLCKLHVARIQLRSHTHSQIQLNWILYLQSGQGLWSDSGKNLIIGTRQVNEEERDSYAGHHFFTLVSEHEDTNMVYFLHINRNNKITVSPPTNSVTVICRKYIKLSTRVHLLLCYLRCQQT
jgi:hypothetical protein